MNDHQTLLDRLRIVASEEGFTMLGITDAVPTAGFDDLVNWIDAGYAGQMEYFADRLDAYRHPNGVLDGARSIVTLAYPYDRSPPTHDSDHRRHSGHGKIARYARSGLDYHDVIHPKLKRMCRIVRESVPESAARGVVDTAPLMEREIAQLAGLGWRGKNTLLLSPTQGSYFFLACVLVDVALPADQAFAADHCGTCTACLDACPTDAFAGPGVLDATRCISYLTIEHRGPIDPALRPGMGSWVFGCDVCQEVCPWNRKPSRAYSKVPGTESIETLDLAELFSIDEDEFRRRFRKSPMWRTRRRGMLRNAAIVLGNQGDVAAIDPLAIGLADGDELVRGTSAWAMGQIGGDEARIHLRNRLALEEDAWVRDEILAALS